MGSNDQEKIKIAREYFMRADQGRPHILELFHENAEVYFPKFGFGFGRNSFLEMVKGFEGALEHIQHDYDRLTFILQATISSLKALHWEEYLVSRGQAAKLLAAVSATSSSFETAEYRAFTFISIPTIRVRMRLGFDGVRIVSGDQEINHVLQHIDLADP